VYDAYILGSLLSTAVTFTFSGTAIPLLFHTTRKTFIRVLDELFYSLLSEVCVLFYQPLGHNCFHVVALFQNMWLPRFCMAMNSPCIIMISVESLVINLCTTYNDFLTTYDVCVCSYRNTHTHALTAQDHFHDPWN